MQFKQEKRICSHGDLINKSHLLVDIEYKKHLTTAIIFEFNHGYYAYINNCMHMQRPLNCQEETIFDQSGKLLRCSMHGFVFEPTTGECLSPVCEGQTLQMLKVMMNDNQLYFVDKHVQLS